MLSILPVLPSVLRNKVLICKQSSGTWHCASCLPPAKNRWKQSVPYDGDKLVVNSFIQPDSVVYLRVTRSQPPGSSSFPEVPGASIELKAGNEVLPLQWNIISGKRYFVSTKPARPGVEYNISVSAPGLDTITAKDTLPRKPLLAEPFAQGGGNRIKFVMKDLPGVDFYRFRLFKGTKNTSGEVVPTERRLFRFDLFLQQQLHRHAHSKITWNPPSSPTTGSTGGRSPS